MNTQTMHDALAGSLAGELTFPQVIGMLAQAGVESYRVDFINGQDVFYLADGRTHTELLGPASAPAAEDLDIPELVALIRAAQADTLRYPQFVEGSLKAGVAAYHVFLNGRKAVYFGRKGDMHTEYFPQE